MMNEKHSNRQLVNPLQSYVLLNLNLEFSERQIDSFSGWTLLYAQHVIVLTKFIVDINSLVAHIKVLLKEFDLHSQVKHLYATITTCHADSD